MKMKTYKEYLTENKKMEDLAVLLMQVKPNDFDAGEFNKLVGMMKKTPGYRDEVGELEVQNVKMRIALRRSPAGALKVAKNIQKELHRIFGP